MNKPYVWTDEKIEKLKQMYPVATWDEMFEYFQTDNKQVIGHKAKQLKIDRTCYKIRIIIVESSGVFSYLRHRMKVCSDLYIYKKV